MSAIEELRDLIESLNYEHEDILCQLPSIQALIDYRNLWDIYDEYLSGIHDCIREGDDPKAYIDFLRKYNLNWKVPEVENESAA